MMTLAHQGANRMKLTLLSIAAIAVAAPSLCRAVGFQNGSFETGVNQPGPFNYRTVGGPSTDITGWVVEHRIDWCHYGAPYAQDGQYWAQVVAGGENGSISQTFDTVAGHSYTVGFWANLQQNDVANSDLHLEFTNGATTEVQAVSLVPSNYDWKYFQFTFTTASGTTSSTIRFNERGTTIGANLDNVSVTGVVPEPASLFALGSGAIALVRRRRSRLV